MIRLCLVLLLTATIARADELSSLLESNGTEAYFLSPNGLGKTDEVSKALAITQQHIKIATTEYNHTSTYTLTNVSIGCAYNDAKQTSKVTHDEVLIKGGRVEFTYQFNFTRKDPNGTVIQGSGFGSVLSDPLEYRKTLYVPQGVEWTLRPKGFTNLSLIQNRMKIKRLNPFSEADLSALEDMLDVAFSAISPANVEVQILDVFNQIFPVALNETLNSQFYKFTYNYTYQSSTHGLIGMNLTRSNYGFGLEAKDGLNLIFLTRIEGWPNLTCTITVPTEHFQFEIYGSSQSVHLNCFYETVLGYLQSRGWLDTVLNDKWETNAFQFYAGDLFDLINNLYLYAKPRSLLDGTCTAQKDGLKLVSAREVQGNTYNIDINYVCEITTTSIQGTVLPVLKYRANSRFYMRVSAEKTSLTFTLISAKVLNLSFDPVGIFYVNNVNLALFKANEMMKRIVNSTVFGTGYATVPRALPRTKVELDYVIYYDSSQLEATDL